jgi:hypothetical protein
LLRVYKADVGFKVDRSITYIFYLHEIVDGGLPGYLIEIRVNSKQAVIVFVEDDIVELFGKDRHVEGHSFCFLQVVPIFVTHKPICGL